MIDPYENKIVSGIATNMEAWILKISSCPNSLPNFLIIYFWGQFLEFDIRNFLKFCIPTLGEVASRNLSRHATFQFFKKSGFLNLWLLPIFHCCLFMSFSKQICLVPILKEAKQVLMATE